MKIAILTLTKGGLERGMILREALELPVDLYGQEKFGSEGYISYESKIARVFSDAYKEYDIIIAIMATGIVIRSIKDLIGHKSQDPGILVMDEKGKHIISLLSGHLGGANYWTNYVARKINAEPVITTASDVTGKISVDQIAERFNLKINSFFDAMKVTAGIVNAENLGIINELNIQLSEKDSSYFDHQSLAHNYLLILGNRSKEEYIDKYNLKPDAYISVLSEKKLVVGIGCRKGISLDHLEMSLKKALSIVDRSLNDVRILSTVDVKKDEEAILMLADKYSLPLNIVDRKLIKEVESRYEISEFVKKTIGVGAVCEPVAELTGKPGDFILRKTAFDGVTISILEEYNE